ncbi:hypothetical protein C2845_PM02G37670 [Panicum miliaceum]|uniref:Glycosyltransferase N-terminal domain-containing protein n=1 Tax=Panicum miliaceum TaxID=4540 RepID=A0A3L6S635_PANMI|nr:hypothetical protein C2845_PM02G37670 [Panicum miliaceum]
MGHEQEHGGRGAGHLLLFPFLAQGHLIPFLNMARRRRGGSGQRRLEVTIVSTPRNVAGLRRAVPAGSSIGFAELPFSPPDHVLPPDAESTDAVPLRSFPAFYFATELLRPPFEELVAEVAGREGRQNVCVLADIFLGWTAESARALGVQHRVFLTSGAYASAVTFSIWLRPPAFQRPAGPDDEQALQDFPDVRVRYVEFLNVVVTEDYATNPMLAYLCRMVSLHFCHSGGLVINTSEEIEPREHDPGVADDGVARGLEASGRPFIWAVRPPVEFDGTEEFRGEWLPDGFEDRVAAAARGVVVRGWAPQVAILAHASTGAFLNHCGWNSVLESLWHGVPVVGWPLMGDQVFDSRMLEQLGVGMEVASGRMFGGLGKGWDHVRDVVDTVLGDGEKARGMRRKAVELKELARAAVSVRDDGEVKGSSVLAMERLLDSAFG